MESLFINSQLRLDLQYLYPQPFCAETLSGCLVSLFFSLVILRGGLANYQTLAFVDFTGGIAVSSTSLTEVKTCNDAIGLLYGTCSKAKQSELGRTTCCILTGPQYETCRTA